MMDERKLERIIRAEALEAPILCGARRAGADSVVLERDGDTWTVYLSDERGAAYETTVRAFDSESDALEHVLVKLRQGEVARQALLRLTERQHSYGEIE